MSYQKEFDVFLKKEIELRDSYSNNASMLEIFRHLILMIPEESFESLFKYYFLEREDVSEGMGMFHKSMRQTDFYPYDELKGHLDVVFWNFLYVTDLPLNMFKTFVKKIKTPKTDENE